MKATTGHKAKANTWFPNVKGESCAMMNNQVNNTLKKLIPQRTTLQWVKNVNQAGAWASLCISFLDHNRACAELPTADQSKILSHVYDTPLLKVFM